MGWTSVLFPEEKALLVAALGQNGFYVHLTVVISWCSWGKLGTHFTHFSSASTSTPNPAQTSCTIVTKMTPIVCVRVLS